MIFKYQAKLINLNLRFSHNNSRLNLRINKNKYNKVNKLHKICKVKIIRIAKSHQLNSKIHKVN